MKTYGFGINKIYIPENKEDEKLIAFTWRMTAIMLVIFIAVFFVLSHVTEHNYEATVQSVGQEKIYYSSMRPNIGWWHSAEIYLKDDDGEAHTVIMEHSCQEEGCNYSWPKKGKEVKVHKDMFTEYIIEE